MKKIKTYIREDTFYGSRYRFDRLLFIWSQMHANANQREMVIGPPMGQEVTDSKNFFVLQVLHMADTYLQKTHKKRLNQRSSFQK